MSKVVIEFDTKTKGSTVTLDGVKMENVMAVDLYRGYCYDDDDDGEKFRFSVTQGEKDKDNDLSKMTRICASQSGDIVTEAVQPSPAGKAVADIVSFFS